MKAGSLGLASALCLAAACASGPSPSAALQRGLESSYDQARGVFYSTLSKAAADTKSLDPADRQALARAEEAYPGLYELLMAFYPYTVDGDSRNESPSRQAFPALAVRLAWEFVRSVPARSPSPELGALESVVISTGYQGRQSTPIYRKWRRPVARPVKGQWGWTELGLKDAQRLSLGAGVRIAVIDTGLDPTIKEIHRQVKDFKDFLAREKPFAAKGRFPYDWSGHGTGVASVVSQVAPESELLVVKIFDEDSMSRVPGNWWTLSLLEAGIAWALEHRADVINLSAAVTFDVERLRTLARRCWEKNVILVASVGNVVDRDEGERMFYPAAYPWAIAVGGVEKSGDVLRVWEHSAWGDYIDVVAPAASIWAERPSYLDRRMFAERTFGNSMATAAVSGTAALVLSALEPEERRALKSRPGALSDTVRDILCQTASNDRLGLKSPNPRSGYGLIHPLEAVRRARGRAAD